MTTSQKKNRFREKFYQAGLHTASFLALFLLAVLTLCCVFFGYYAEDMNTQASIAHLEHFPQKLLGSLALAAVCAGLPLFLERKFGRHTARIRRLFLALSTVWAVGFGILLVLLGRCVPAADPASVYMIADSLAAGQTGVIHPTDSYLSYYPQQIGLVAYQELFMRLFRLFRLNYHAWYFQCINALFAGAIVFFQHQITYLLSGKSDAAAMSYSLLAMLNAPLLFYTSYVYGELPSFAFLCGGIWLFTKFSDDSAKTSAKSRILLPLSLILLVTGVALRKNSLIVIIAVVITAFFEWLKTRRKSLLFYAVLLAAGALTVLPAIQGIYEYRAGNRLSSGVPAIAYAAMGMQESNRGNGWYNGFNFNTYEQSRLDTRLTAELSRSAIRDSLRTFREYPAYACLFYAEKFLSQWTDGTFFCRQATNAHSDKRAAIVEALYTGSLSLPFNHYCNLYLLLVYAGALLCLLLLRRMRQSSSDPACLYPYVGVIAVLGGFLFHMVWEANSRYILPYFLLLLPYAATGLSAVLTRRKYCGKPGKDRRPDAPAESESQNSLSRDVSERS